VSAADRARGEIGHVRDPQDVADLRAYAATIAPVTAEDLAEIERLTSGLESAIRYHAEHAAHGGVTSEFHARAETTMRSAASLLPRLARDLADARADRTRLADRVLDLGTQNETLREDLARSRLVNEQAEKVRDENDRLRGAIATALKHAGTDSRTPEFTVFDTRDVEKLRGLAR
jgi:hypothetical protein